MPSNHLILCFLLLLLPSIFSSIRVFSNELALRIKWPKAWSFSFSMSPSSEYSGLISFRIDWLDLLAVQGTLKSLLQTIVQKRQFCVCVYVPTHTVVSGSYTMAVLDTHIYIKLNRGLEQQIRFNVPLVSLTNFY